MKWYKFKGKCHDKPRYPQQFIEHRGYRLLTYDGSVAMYELTREKFVNGLFISVLPAPSYNDGYPQC